ncbi:MAG: hypothetical protein ACK5KO_07910 [Arachnia sp.]
MPKAHYPGPEFPAPVAVTVNYPPAGWEPIKVPEAHLSIGSTTTTSSQFRANVVVTSKRTNQITLAAAAQATVQQLESSPEWGEALREFRPGLGGYECFRIEGAFSHPQAGTLYQAAEITVVARGPYVDVVQLVGTCSASQTESLLPQIRTMLAEAKLYEV